MELKKYTKACYTLLDAFYQVKDVEGRKILLVELAENKTDFLKKQIKSLNEITTKALLELGENIEKPKKLECYADSYDEEGNLVYDMAVCPECHREFEIDYDEHCDYCPSCGQKLDWSDIEKEREELN